MNEVATMEGFNKNMRIVEIGGVKLEVDMRRAIKVEQYRVGDNIKVLVAEGYGDNKDWKVYPGVIAGFIQFKNKPTIVIAYLKMEYSNAEINFINLTQDTKDVEIAPALPEEIPMKEADIMAKLEHEIIVKEKELTDAKSKKNYFVKHFKKYFEK